MPPANPAPVATASDIEEAILALLPDDGTPVLNRKMQVMLTHQLRRSITQEDYFAARDRLFEKELIGRARGPGGFVFLSRQQPVRLQPEIGRTTERWTENDLMPPLCAYLEGAFRVSLDLPESALCIVHDTSQIGPPKGRWVRPDYIVVSATKFRLMPGAQVNVYSFELKKETGVTNLAVYEALAQTRFTHFGYLVWHLPRGSKREDDLLEIATQCNEQGVGLIRLFDPKKPHEAETLVDPVRKDTSSRTVETFLETRLTHEQQTSLQQAITGLAQ